MKKFTSQLLEFKITKNKLKMEIRLKDLAWLFRNSPDNVAGDGEHELCRIRQGKKHEFAGEFVRRLMDDSPYDENNTRWEALFGDVFQEMRESGDEFLQYYDGRPGSRHKRKP